LRLNSVVFPSDQNLKNQSEEEKREEDQHGQKDYDTPESGNSRPQANKEVHLKGKQQN
jgi:hypothetical protein